MQFISDAQAGKLSPALAEKAKKKVLKKSSAGQGSGYADEIRKIIKRKPSIVGDAAKGGPYKPGYKPQLSVRTAKKGTFSSIDTDRILAQMKVRHAGGLPKATKYKKYLKSLGKATSSRFPANVFTAGKTGLGEAQLKAHLKTKLPTAKVGIAKKLLRKTGFGKALAVATAAGAGYEAGKRGLLKLKNKKVQKKATGGEIIIGKGVDIDLL